MTRPRGTTSLVHHNKVQTNQMHPKPMNQRIPSVSLSLGHTLYSRPIDLVVWSSQSTTQSIDLLKVYLLGKTISMQYLKHMVSD